MIRQLRCNADHPKIPRRVCNQRLADVRVAGDVRGVELQAAHGDPPEGSASIRCSRCGTTYHVSLTLRGTA